jgi:DNA-binding transcriptional ArsR family regulator
MAAAHAPREKPTVTPQEALTVSAPEQPTATPQEVLTVSAPEQYRALGHPLRHRLLFALGQQPATISQLAAALNSHKGNIAHHLKVLRDAGMVAVVQTRQVRGGTEQYYQRTAKKFHFTGEEIAAETAIMLRAVADDLVGAAAEPVLILRHVRLSGEQAMTLARTLTDLCDGIPDAGAEGVRYGLLVGLYQPGHGSP